jgi:hypothetical protein
MLALDTGRLIVEGTPEDVINHHAVVESYLGTEGYADLVSNSQPSSRPRRRRVRR